MANKPRMEQRRDKQAVGYLLSFSITKGTDVVPLVTHSAEIVGLLLHAPYKLFTKFPTCGWGTVDGGVYLAQTLQNSLRIPVAEVRYSAIRDCIWDCACTVSRGIIRMLLRGLKLKPLQSYQLFLHSKATSLHVASSPKKDRSPTIAASDVLDS